jgi:hypothetical protein
MYRPQENYKWVEKFKGGQTGTVDDPRSSWPSIVTFVEVKEHISQHI